MKPEVESLFHELADLSPDQREKYFERRQVSEEVRAEVEALLGFDSRTNDGSLTGHVASSAERSLLDNLEPDPRCGPYRLLGVLGYGGMGSVYLAERADGEVEQRVAIKFIGHRRHEPAFVDRFLRERQILATLSHPGIARLLDVGHTSDGQPYLAMEYVDGLPIDTYAAKLDLRGKLALFLKACEAVSYAHRNLIIHRDLKPSNILVESSGEVKLLDFGIAKFLDATLDQTLTQERILTPAFASPEQVRGTAQATTSDVYSLGAVLFKLLTGESPHALSTQSQQAIELAVCHTKPSAPSSIKAGLPKDLDFIILKALRKEPEERYSSVDALTDDIRAFLELRPVSARRGNIWYRSRKFLRRYWAPTVTAAAIVGSLSAGLFVANRERTIAQRHFMEVRQLSNKLFDIDALARQLPGSTKTRQLIVDTSLEYLGRLSADAQGDPGLALEVGNAYMWVARVQGVPIAANLGQVDQADKNLRLAEGFIHSVLVSQPGNRIAILRSAEVARDRTILADINLRADETNALARQSAAALEKFNAQKADQPEAKAILLTYLNLAQIYEHYGWADDALALCRRGSELARLFGRSSSRGTFLQVAAKIYQSRGDLDQALRSIQESTAVLEPGPGNADQSQTMNYVMSLVYAGQILGGDNAISLGRTEEAIAMLKRAGATGFIGSAIVPELTNAGHQVLGLTRSDAGARSLIAAGAEAHHGSLEDPKSLRSGAAQTDGVIHCAFDHSAFGSDFSKFLEVCEKDRGAIEALGDALKGSGRPLLITSGTGMGNAAPGQPATEDHFDPDHPNPRRLSEVAGAALSERGVNVSVVRLPQVHDTVKQGLITYAIQVAREKGASAYIGEGLNRWPAAHVLDVARLYRLALEKGEAGSRYNAVAEEGVSMREIAEVIGRGLKVPVVSLSQQEAQAHFGWLAMFAGADMPALSALTRQRLGWRPTGPGLIADLEQMNWAEAVTH